ncbi:S8 family serine peptidase [Acuticoccus kandeliae]|uniref:S8 family serine peptidase n=1 Tax=Acuticoccus kandeliae TaxID=2073160 RepID=UPI001300B97E|nr:S8 family serine peptidase [Acuticoccus kandeliae]
MGMIKAVGCRAILLLAALSLGILATVPGFTGPAEAFDGRGGDNNGRGGGGGYDGGGNTDRLIIMPPPTRVIVEPNAEPAPRTTRRPRQAAPRRASPRREAAPTRRAAPRQSARRTAPAAPAVTPPAPEIPPAPLERPNEILALGLDDAALAALVAAGYGEIDRVTIALLGDDLVRLSVPAGTDLDAARTAVLAAAPNATVDVNSVYVPSEDACEGVGCMGISLVGWPVAARASDGCGAGITLAIVDTGINPAHEALAAADIALLPLFGKTPQVSQQSHGTAVASILVGGGDERIKGLLPRARLVAVDAFEDDAEGRTLSDAYRLVAALDLVAAETPTVLNLSLSGPANAILEKALDAVADKGILIVAAVGNEGPAAPPQYPAAYDTVVAVTAVDAESRIYRRAVRGDHVDFAAPGVEIWTAASVRGAKPKSGTSFASPFVAAALALAARNGATDKPAALTRVRDGVHDLGDTGRDPIFGWGLLNAADLCVPNDAPALAATTATAE